MCEKGEGEEILKISGKDIVSCVGNTSSVSEVRYLGHAEFGCQGHLSRDVRQAANCVDLEFRGIRV